MAVFMGCVFGLIQMWLCFFFKTHFLMNIPPIYDFPVFMSGVFSMIMAIYVGAVFGSRMV